MSIWGGVYKFFVSLFNKQERAKLKIRSFNAHEIKRNKYGKFYNPQTLEAQVLMGHFFYDIYKCVQPFQNTLLKAEKSTVLKELIFNRYLDDKGRELLYAVSESNIKTEAASMTIEELSAEVSKNITAIEKYFNEAWKNRVDKLYKYVIRFGWFINFDYAGLLRRFTGSELIDDISFSRVKASSISEYIKDFLSVSVFLEEKIDWLEILTVLSEFDENIPNDDRWSKIYPSLHKVLKSGILSLIVRHIESNADWSCIAISGGGSFADDYISMINAAAFKTLGDIDRDIKNTKIDELVRRVFPDKIAFGALNYNEEESEIYESGGFGRFVYAKQFNYIYLFFYTFCDPIRSLANFILIKGNWSAREASSELSQLIHNLNDRFQELGAFDHSISESGERGMKLHGYYTKSSIGRRHADNLRKYIDTVNFEADEIITHTMHTITQFHKHLAALDEERKNNQFIMIHNWPEVEFGLKEFMPLTDAVKKMGDFLVLVNFVLNNSQ